MAVGVIILAGGKSSRMGQDKGLLEINGKALTQHVIDQVKEFSKEIIIISNNQEYAKFGYPVYPDLIKNIGPLGGIYTGLTQSKHEVNFVISCDTPFVSSNLIEELFEKIDQQDVVISEFQNKLNPLIGFYNQSIIPIIEKAILEKAYKVSQIFTDLSILNVDLSHRNEKEFLNLNTREDIIKNNE